MAGDFSTAVLNEDDPALVRDAAPAYLLMMDALLVHHDQVSLWLAAANLNSAYAAAFVDDPARKLLMTEKALNYAVRAACGQDKNLCTVRQMPADDLTKRLRVMDQSQLPLLMTLGSVWAGWIQARSSDWNAVADLPKVQVLMERIIAVDSGYDEGEAHLYLGGIETLLPAALGGRQVEGEAHLRQAFALSHGHDLMAWVVLARQVARARYDRPMHDSLLKQVLAADPHAPGWTLKNYLAQQQARELLKSADDYF
ncbi:MAG: hypothetical protein HKM02_01010 [Pseudomonadales bacterium]|nr:hypothetical protein [Pseudomonadales bacterium]